MGWVVLGVVVVESEEVGGAGLVEVDVAGR